MSRLLTIYNDQIKAKLKENLSIDNVHQVPALLKVVINVGVGRGLQDAKFIDSAVNTLRKITGQHPVVTRAKHSIAGFKLRQGAKIGVKVTLRGRLMYEFIDRLVNVVLPRTRDFRGLATKAFDRDGNYNIGINDQSVFPELTFEDTQIQHGLQITLVTTTSDQAASQKLLEAFGFPFERRE